MSKVHYFQRYTQKENVVTNNTLLLFSRLYNNNPLRFETFINSLLSDSDVSCDIGPVFTQQQGNNTGSSIPDGAITQKSIKVLIETKLYNNQDKGQLIRHLAGFKKEDTQVLLLINPSEPTEKFNKSVINAVASHNTEHETSIRYCAVTFKQIIEALGEVLPEYDIEMQEVLEDYQGFCSSEKLLATHENVMRAITAGGSFKDNLLYDVYFDSVSRGYSPHNYLGLYTKKSVRAVGKISKIVRAQYNSDRNEFESITIVKGSPITDEEKARIEGIMNAAMKNNGWNVYRHHNFFMVDKFYETNYKKTTKYPIQKTKFFELKKVLGGNEIPECETLAQLLTEQTWG
ncbi:MAG: hypothetical protein RPS47_18630 [Colwellia sp.]|jgi:hypothetical protein